MTGKLQDLLKRKDIFTIKNLLRIVAFVIIIFLIYSILNSIGNYLQQEHIKRLILEAGGVGFLTYGAYYLFSVIIAPFPLIAILTVIASIYGVGEIVLYTYFLSLAGATINFYIARYLGRPVLKKLIGERGFKKVDKYTENFGVEALILFRLFGAIVYEYVSFAAGLSSMQFRTYILISAIASIPYHILLYIVLSSVDKPGDAFVVFFMFAYIGITIPIIYFIIKPHVLKKALRKGNK